MEKGEGMNRKKREADKSKICQLLGSAGLLLAAAIWGMSFVVVKDSTESVPVMYLMFLRYLIAVTGMLPFLIIRRKGMTGKVIRQGALLGLVLFGCQYFQTLGSKYTTAGKNAFLSAIYVILVPFILWFSGNRRPDRRERLASVIAMIGIALLTLQGKQHSQTGDWLTLVCGGGLAVHIVLIDRYSEISDGIWLAFLQFFFAAVYAGLLVLFLDIPFPEQVLVRPLSFHMLYLGLGSTMLGFLLQTVCQKMVQAAAAAVLLSLEALFGMFFSILLLGEVLTGQMTAGCILLFGAVLLVELR